ncbi:hypothetical protein B0H63DRAFT_78756 [Podospora didyma]|uniref:Nephrocystin 3-like N-terminal domain-containing protein n=1 Tax=Podospora didyma TaxID=330526 RepID=A0AAE0K2X7_9PEZI|nr:hypothetical protein B0H63DRAFT_78756 [Podospora didyma]
MQHNIKGLHCSLLYQLLSEECSTHLLDTVSQASSRDSDSDWSLNDVRKILLDSLASLPYTVCIFIDGLDEISPKDGATELLQLVQTMRNLPNTKLCVSSRRQPQLQHHLGQHPMLRLQDLTAKDIFKVSRASLRLPTAGDKDWALVINHIVDKSDGVFLWVRLVLKSVQSGIDNGDTFEEVQSRLDAFPSDLNGLYKDMWQRLNEDQHVYRQSAALYFKLVLTALDECVFAIHQTLSFTELTAAFHDDLLSRDAPPSADVLRQKCEATVTQVGIRCAGLLEAQETGKTLES